MTNDKIDYAWLQISDLHIFENTEWNTMRDAYKKLPYQNEIRFIIITGDLHQYKTDYEQTKEFLGNLLDLFCLSKKDIFIVPGNHDSGDCNTKSAITEYIENHIEKEPDCYREYLKKGNLLDCFTDYNNFIKAFYDDKAYEMYPEPEQVNVITWNHSLNIIHLNTAINCNGNNELQQIVDIYQVSNLAEKLNNACPSVIIAHHPFNIIHRSHRNFLTRYISDWNVSAYLCGDLHKEVYSPIMTHKGSGNNIPCIVCGKGAPEVLDDYSDLGCIIYVKRKNSKEIEVCPYEWDSEKKNFNQSERLNSDEGHLTFRLLDYKNSKVDKSKRYMKKTGMLSEGESIWLPDAEFAKGEQSRFGNFVSTSIIDEFIQNDSAFWGLSAVKGIGKTFVLQIKRRAIKKDRLCLPVGIEISAATGWGTDTIRIERNKNLSALKEFGNVTALWKYCIIVYVVNQLINIKQNIKRYDFGEENPEEPLKKRLKQYFDEERISRETYLLCTWDEYINLNIIMNGVLGYKHWVDFVINDISSLILLQRKIKEMLRILNKHSVVILIDKVDQALRQTNAEVPVNCDICKKINKIKQCNNEKKSPEYCADETTLCKYECCYGCEKYETPYSNTDLRVYGGNTHQFHHINLWQYIQMGLLCAVSEIKQDFERKVEIYFTIREEAFCCEPDLLGEHGPKIMQLTNELWYTKEQQQQIFYDCIYNQQDKLLFNPILKNQPGRLEEAFVGVGKLCHPYVDNLSESVFESIYRHSFDRARDIQEYGEMLTKHMDEIRQCDTILGRGEKVKELIEEKAAELAFFSGADNETKSRSYYVEKMNLLPNYWADPENFKKLLLMFSKNLLFGKEAKYICRKYNSVRKCGNSCAECPARHHPFSMLYKLGMLGQLKVFHTWIKDVKQKFLHSKEVTYITGKQLINLNKDTIYILHPALTKSIEHMGRKVRHFSGFILGKGMSVPEDILRDLVSDFENMTDDEYDKKYFYDK